MSDKNEVWLVEVIPAITLEDSGWALLRDNGRGMRDFGRQIRFNRELTEEERDRLCDEMAEHADCPGWTGVTCRRSGFDDMRYAFSTCYDSSD